MTTPVPAKKEHCEHHEECMKLIQRVLDNQALPEEVASVEANLGKCLPCAKGYQLEQAIKEALQFRLAKKLVPQGLADCIRRKIQDL